MPYKYITRNNLYNKQSYMYSEYGGVNFLKEYIKSRQVILKQNIEEKKYSNSKCYKHENTYNELHEVYKKLKDNGVNKEILKKIYGYNKSFEVRKRLYDAYDSNWKPVEGAGFEDYDNYLLLAEILGIVYEQTQCLKWFNCMLKIDDTLLSLVEELSVEQLLHLKSCIEIELISFSKLLETQGIIMEEQE